MWGQDDQRLRRGRHSCGADLEEAKEDEKAEDSCATVSTAGPRRRRVCSLTWVASADVLVGVEAHIGWWFECGWWLE